MKRRGPSGTTALVHKQPAPAAFGPVGAAQHRAGTCPGSTTQPRPETQGRRRRARVSLSPSKLAPSHPRPPHGTHSFRLPHHPRHWAEDQACTCLWGLSGASCGMHLQDHGLSRCALQYVLFQHNSGFETANVDLLKDFRIHRETVVPSLNSLPQ